MVQKILQEEKKLWKKGHKGVVGLDEAGRGALCGPVVAAAVMIRNPKSQITNYKQYPNSNDQNSKRFEFRILNLFRIWNLEFEILGIRDSKKLSSKKREEFYKILTVHPGIEWGIGRVSEKKIDKINILEATKLAMEKAINNLKSKIQNPKSKINSKSKAEFCNSKMKRKKKAKLSSPIQNPKPDFLILDGNFELDLPIPQKAIVKADEKVFSCMAAGIIAKVTRDRIMQKYAKKYPQYGFEKHKGYPTKLHLKMLKKHTPSTIHRKTFRPVKVCGKIKSDTVK